MKTYRSDSIHFLAWLLFLGVMFLFAINITQFVSMYWPKYHTINCEKMNSLDQALDVLRAGHVGLDRNHDGKPCQKQFPNQ